MNERKTVLLIEDDLTLLYLNKRALEQAGYRVIPVRSLKDAREYLARGSPSAVVMDVEAQDGSVSDFCRALRDIGNIPIVILSSESDKGGDKGSVKGSDKEGDKGSGKQSDMEGDKGSVKRSDNGSDRVSVKVSDKEGEQAGQTEHDAGADICKHITKPYRVDWLTESLDELIIRKFY